MVAEEKRAYESVSRVTYDRRTPAGTVSSTSPAEIWPEWQEGHERWLFMSAHDDDIVTGCGQTLIAAIQAGIECFAGITTNGKMGYCSPGVKDTIAEIRQKECIESFRQLGLPDSNLYFLGFDDGNLNQEAGRRFANSTTEGPILEGATGLQNSFTWLIRKVCPTRIFLPSITDLHPDHRMTNSEMVISIFHAQGNIWPELGVPVRKIPLLYEYPTYSNLRTSPEWRIRVTKEICEKRLQAIYAYQSQEQIELLVNSLKKTGPVEFLREMAFDIFNSQEANKLFS